MCIVCTYSYFTFLKLHSLLYRTLAAFEISCLRHMTLQAIMIPSEEVATCFHCSVLANARLTNPSQHAYTCGHPVMQEEANWRSGPVCKGCAGGLGRSRRSAGRIRCPPEGMAAASRSPVCPAEVRVGAHFCFFCLHQGTRSKTHLYCLKIPRLHSPLPCP